MKKVNMLRGFLADFNSFIWIRASAKGLKAIDSNETIEDKGTGIS